MLKHHTKLIWTGILGLAVCAALASAAYFYSHRPPVIKPTPINTSTGNENGKVSPTITTVPTQGTPNKSGNTGSSSGGTPQATLVAPSGSFVSNHKPNLSGSPAPNTEESTCEVPQFISCNIRFTNTSTGRTFSLGTQTAGANGIVAWHWSLQGVGITQGSWTIEAVSALGAQTKTTSDPLTLDVKP